MESPDTSTPDFFTTLYEFKRHYEEKLFRLKRSIDNKNIGILVDLQASSYDINDKTHKDLEDVVSLQHKADLVKATVDCLKAILNTKEEVPSLVEKAPDVLETLVWLLNKDETPFFKDQFKAAGQVAFGAEGLANLESLKDINAEELEETFKLEINKERLTEYLAHIETVYIPEEGATAPEQPDIPQDSKDMTKEVKAVSDYTLVNLKSTRNFTKSHEVKLKKDPYKSLNECIGCHPTGKSAKISKNFVKVGEVKIPNRAVHFDFGQNGNCLKVSAANGEVKSDVDFYKQLNSSLKSQNQHFVDEVFPAKPTSITNDFVKYPNVPNIPWKTIPEVYSKKHLVLCSDEISPNDINQGNLGNCFYLSALSALAEDKILIKRLFQSKEISPTGCYSVWLCDSGEWKQILVDDYIPYDTVKGTLVPRFSRSKGNDIWVLLLEKAYAKLHGNYYVTSSGFQGEAFSVLTGAPIKYFLPKHRGTDPLKNIWTFITNAAKNNFVITAAGRQETAVLKHKSLGLVSGHAYALLDAQEVALPDGKTERIVKMRNPWGTVEWKGDWGDSSARWTPELLSSLNYLPKALDGVFWISVADFDKYFSQLCVSQVIPENKFSFIKLGEGKKQNVFIAKMKVDTPGFVYLSVQQKRNKFFQGNPAYVYSYARIILAKTDEDGKIVKFIHGKSKREQSVTIRRELEQGNYLVLIEMDWVQKFYNEVVLTAYAPMEVDIQEERPENYSIESLYEQVVRAAFTNSSITNIKSVQLKLGTKEYNATKSFLGIRFGLSSTMLTNQEKDLTLYYKIIVKTLENFEVYVPKSENPTTIIVRVPPGEERIIIFKANMGNPKAQNSSLNYGDTHSFRTELTPEQLKELCKEKGNKMEPIKDGKVTLHTLSYMGGVARYYTNANPELTFHDNMTFASDDLVVNGQETKTFEVVVKPGEDFLLDCKVKDPFAGAKMDRSTKAKMVKE